MKITFPHMGNLAIPIETIFTSLGLEVILPPPTSKKTIALGARYAPEQICLPFKINLGNLIESYQMGANTIVMLGGCGPCRFGYYGSLLHQILTELGLDYKFIYFDEDITATIKEIKKQEGFTWWQIGKAIYLAYEKLKLVEEIEDSCNYYRATMDLHGQRFDLEDQLDNYIEAVSKAGSMAKLNKLRTEFSFWCHTNNSSKQQFLRIALVGDIYTILEPQCNFDIIRELGKRGVIVVNTISVSNWLKQSLLGFKHSREGQELLRIARPYLKSQVGGHGIHTVGNTVKQAKRVDGVVHLMPLSCTPEIVAATLLPGISREREIPILSISVDEHTANGAIITRLEAFIDILMRKTLNS